MNRASLNNDIDQKLPDNKPAKEISAARLRGVLKNIVANVAVKEENEGGAGGATDEQLDQLKLELEAEIDARVAAARVALLGGAGAAYDTLKELEDKLTSEESATATILNALANKANLDGSGIHPGAEMGTGFASIPAGQESFWFVNGFRQWVARLFLRLPVQTTTPIAAPGVPVVYGAQDNGVDVVQVVDSTNFIYRLGRDLVLNGRNDTGATLTKGTVVYLSGYFAGSGNVPLLAKASAQGPGVTATPAVGLVAADIANNSIGRVLIKGRLDGLNTTGNGLVDGGRLLLGVTAGTFTGTRPELPNHTQRLGIVMRSHATQGSVIIDVAALTTNIPGTAMNTYQVGDGTSTLSKILRFLAGFTGDLTHAVLTAGRTWTLPDVSGVIALLSTVITATLNGLGPLTGTITSSDSIITAFGRVKNFIDTIGDTVRGTLATGLDVNQPGTPLATDSFLVILGKLIRMANTHTHLTSAIDAAAPTTPATVTVAGTSVGLDLTGRYHTDQEITAQANFILSLTGAAAGRFATLTIVKNTASNISVSVPAGSYGENDMLLSNGAAPIILSGALDSVHIVALRVTRRGGNLVYLWNIGRNYT